MTPIIRGQDDVIELMQTVSMLEERSKQQALDMASLKVTLTEVLDRISNIEHIIKKDVDENYVRKQEFAPVRNVVYGVVAFLLMTMGGFLVSSLSQTTHLSISAPTHIPIGSGAH